MSSSSGPLHGSIGQIAVNAHDLERATAFYRDTLGLTHLFGAESMAFFDCDGVRLMLGVAERPEFDHPSSILYFRVADTRDAYRDLRAKVDFIDEPICVHRTDAHELWLAFFRDTEGNTMALMSEVPLEG